MNIGDKVKFTEYLNYNPFSGARYMRTITGKRVGFNRGIILHGGITHEGNTVIRKAWTIVEDDPQEGIYLGYRRKKLTRIYRTDVITTDREQQRIEMNSSMFRHSMHNPRRVDDPFDLEKVALVRLNEKRIIQVPMSNIFKYNGLINCKLL
jgi:hypothetical protein